MRVQWSYRKRDSVVMRWLVQGVPNILVKQGFVRAVTVNVNRYRDGRFYVRIE